MVNREGMLELSCVEIQQIVKLMLERIVILRSLGTGGAVKGRRCC